MSDGVPCSAYRTVAEALRDPQIAHRGALSEVKDGGGTFKVLNLPFRMSGANVSRGKADVDPGRAHRYATLRRPAFRKMKSRLSRGNRWWQSRADGKGASERKHNVRLCGLAGACDSSQSGRTVSNDPEYRTDGILEGASYESGDRARARFAQIFLAAAFGVALFAAPAHAQKQGGSITVGLELDIPGFDPLKVGVFDTSAETAAAAIFDTLTTLDDKGEAAAEARAVLDPFGRFQDLDLQAAARRQIPRRHAVQCRSREGQFRPAEGSGQQMPLCLLHLLHPRCAGARRTDGGL